MNVKKFLEGPMVFIHCRTEEQAKALVKKIHEVDKQWGNCDDISEDNCWKYKENTCFDSYGYCWDLFDEYVTDNPPVIEFAKLEDFKTASEKADEVQMMIDKAITNPQGLEVIVDTDRKIIKIPDLKLNEGKKTEFSYAGLKNIVDFKCQVIHYCTSFVDPREYGNGYITTQIEFVEYMLDTVFSKREFNALYCRFGGGRNHDLCVKFASGSYSMPNFYDEFMLRGMDCATCDKQCFPKKSSY